MGIFIPPPREAEPWSSLLSKFCDSLSFLVKISNFSLCWKKVECLPGQWGKSDTVQISQEKISLITFGPQESGWKRIIPRQWERICKWVKSQWLILQVACISQGNVYWLYITLRNRTDKYLRFHWDTFEIPKHPLCNLLSNLPNCFAFFPEQVIIIFILVCVDLLLVVIFSSYLSGVGFFFPFWGGGNDLIEIIYKVL